MPIHHRRLAVVALALLAGRAGAASSTQVRDELVRLTQQLMDAIPRGDADVWRRTLADDAIVVDEFGRRQDKRAAVDGIRPFPQGFSGSIEIRDPQLRLHGDTAVLGGEMFEQERVFDQQLVVRYIFSNTFVRRDGRWQLLAAIDVTLPTQPPALDVAGLRLDDYTGVYRYGPQRAFEIAVDGGRLVYAARVGGRRTPLDAIAKDVFMEQGDERNLLIFRRDAAGRVDALIERRKFNDLRMTRTGVAAP